MATIKQTTAFKAMLENVRNRNPKALGEILRSAGYKEISKQPSRVIGSQGWQELMNKNFPDKRIQDLINKALKEYEGTGKIEDKRAFLGLMDMLIKLKDKYPAGKIKIGAYDERDRVTE